MFQQLRSHVIANWLLLGLSLSNAQTPKEQSVAEIVKHSFDAVVQIVTSDSFGKEMALGSGFVVSSDGRVVTNYHVIKGAHSAVIKLSNGASFSVDGVLAEDADRDLAALKVSGTGLPFLTLADADKTQVGEHVIAIGSPLGLQNTVSDGIVSALREENSHQWIQTTAPVSHGNSGGPLLNRDGAVIGVITWGINLQQGQNLNFAASVAEVQRLLTQLHEVRPLDIVQSLHKTEPIREISHATWTSLTNGRDYSVRVDGDYIYSEWVNMPKELQGTGAFVRSELKKGTDGSWHGKSRAYIPCNHHATVKWCKQEQDLEIDKLSDSRIEGIATNWDSFDCGKCSPKNVHQQPFAWIPKE